MKKCSVARRVAIEILCEEQMVAKPTRTLMLFERDIEELTLEIEIEIAEVWYEVQQGIAEEVIGILAAETPGRAIH